MKTTTILASAVAILVLNTNSFASNQSSNLLNSVETNKNNIASVFMKNGRNNNVRINQDGTAVQFAVINNNKIMIKIMPKGRTLKAIERIEGNSSSYAIAGRNKKTFLEIFSMN